MYFKTLFSSILLILCGYTSLFAQEFPAKPTTLVNDYTNTLSAGEIAFLEQKLVAFDDSTSNQIAVVILKSVGDYDINKYALELGRKWGVGGKEKNNGVILLIALGDRKLSIQTGYGLEGALPDVYTKRIIENDIKPYFKNAQYFQGISAGVDSIIALTKGEYKAAPKSNTKEGAGLGSVLALIVMIVIIILVVKKGGGGGNGGRGEVFDSRGGMSNMLFWAMLLGSNRGNDNDNDWGGGFGGGFGSGGGGGFGGFGGGSFGGGGSSGSW